MWFVPAYIVFAHVSTVVFFAGWITDSSSFKKIKINKKKAVQITYSCINSQRKAKVQVL